MEYGKVIGGAYRIALHNWRLWPFGLFAGGGLGGNFNFSFDTGSGSDDPDYPGGDGLDPDVIIAIVLVVLVLVVFALIMSVLSQGALTEGVAAIDRGEERRFRQAFRAGRATFWRVTGLGLLGAAIAIAVLLALALVAGGGVLAVFAITESIAVRILVAVLAVLAVVLVLFIVLLPLALILQHGIRELVLGGARPVAALRAGWALLRANPGPSILLFLIQQGLILVAYVVVGLAALLLSLPAIIALVATSAGTGGIVVAVITGLIVIPAALAAVGAVGTFGHGLWTLGYLRMR